MFNNFSVGRDGDTTYVALHFDEDGFTLEYDFVFQDDPEARDYFGEVYWARVTAYPNPTSARPRPVFAETKHTVGIKT
jgi:hypothetical protein